MGEATNPPEENANPEIEFEHGPSDEEMEEDDDLTEEEVKALDNKLDALNGALDAMEVKREEIHSQLIELLEVSKQMREEMARRSTEQPSEENSSNKSGV